MDIEKAAEKIAEEIFRLIERDRRIIKADFVDAARKALAACESPEASKSSGDIYSKMMGFAVATYGFDNAKNLYASNQSLNNTLGAQQVGLNNCGQFGNI